MRNLLLVAVAVFTFLFTLNSYSQDEGVTSSLSKEKSGNLNKANKISKERDLCEEKNEEVTKFLKVQPECFVDEDCTYFNYGYPFQPAACAKAIISKSEEDRNLQKIAKVEQYRQNCVYNDDEENKKYMEFSENLAKEEQSCSPIRLYCLKGFCRRKNYSVQMLDYGSANR